MPGKSLLLEEIARWEEGGDVNARDLATKVRKRLAYLRKNQPETPEIGVLTEKQRLIHLKLVQVHDAANTEVAETFERIRSLVTSRQAANKKQRDLTDAIVHEEIS